jgi:chromosome segregation ATPase
LVLPETSASINADSTTVASEKPESESRADKRYDEMLGKMRAAVEEIAQLYGNPVFLQVFTNDAGKAAELKERLKAAQGTEEIRRELENLEKKRNDLMSDIALKERETAKLTAKLTRQRAALDMVAAAVDQARQAVEDTAK